MWTRDALASEARPWQGSVWRVVESQSHVSTMKLVDNLEDQRLLETVIDATKPAYPPGCARLDHLLATPFRYAPYPHGSRFRRAGQPEGAFYASATPETAVAELAFYRLLFFLEAPGMTFPANALEHTAFSVRAATPRALDLAAPPLNRDAPLWTHPTDYAECQTLADTARGTETGALLYRSVRDPNQGTNIALLSPTTLVSTRPERLQTWRLLVRPTTVQAFHPFSTALEFDIATWSTDPRIAHHLARSEPRRAVRPK